MRAAQVTAPRHIEIVDVPEPRLNGAAPGMIKVRVERACLCGSDSPWFTHKERYPQPPGESIHECIGTVVESTSSRFAVGDLALAVPYGQAGLVDYFCVADANAIPLPRGQMPLERLLMAQPLGTAIWACRKLPNLIGLDTVIVGQGPMGLLFSHLLSNMGARTAIGLDRLDYRLEAARAMRATHTVNVDRQDPVAAVREITDGKMADVAFEVVGHQSVAIDLCLDLVRRLGTVVAFGSPDRATYRDFPYEKLFRQNLTLIGSVTADPLTSYPLARDMILQGRIDVSPLITHILPFSEVQKAFELFVDRRDRAIKVVLDYKR